ncbi:MAG: manganese efflux pump MntP family protein, partial [Cyanobacteria bacterium P01_F01_bin.153]
IKNIKLSKALKIALAFGVFQALMPLLGWSIGLGFREFLVQSSNWIAFILLTLIGSNMIYENLQDEEEKDKFNPLDNYTLLGLAIATSIDALVVGASLSILGNSILTAAAKIGAITFCLSLISVYLGHKWGSLCKVKLEIVGGVILIFLGSRILLTHLIS